jgi:PqqD family protein of HPr-rel-A system
VTFDARSPIGDEFKTEMPGGEGSWEVPASIRLIWREWDDEFVVYNVASGATHLLNVVAGEALRSIEERSATRSELARRLAAKLDIPAGSEPLNRLGELLAQFEELGLAAPIKS